MKHSRPPLSVSSLRTVCFVSLGCPKNEVDTSVMAALLQEQGLELVPDPASADVIVVNTCSFIGDAREESIDVLLEMANHRTRGRCRRLIATGCLPQRNGDELAEAMPEIDALVGTGTLDQIVAAVNGDPLDAELLRPAHFLQSSLTPRLLQPGRRDVYVKIADGCSRRCSFCAIPGIRGPMRSRTINEIVEEARRLADAGVLEMTLVAQDTARYGADLSDGTDLSRLLRALSTISKLRWIRVMYLYPDSISDTLLHTIQDLEKVVPYLDIPIQHASGAILKAMRRGHGPEALRRLMKRVHRILPDAFLRTTVMVGFPGETDDDVAELLRFMQEFRFHHLGAFRYSDEEGTPAFQKGPVVSKRVSYHRFRRVMALQRRIVQKRQRALLGQTVEVLVEGTGDDHGFVLVGRHAGQAKDIDGVTWLTSFDAKVGDMVQGRVTGFKDYDLVVSPLQME